MAKARGGKGRLTVRVEGLEEAARIPGWLETGQEDMQRRAGDKIADDIRLRAPGGPGGKAGRAIHVVPLGSKRIAIESRGFEGARALNEGAYIRSRRGAGTAVRFTVGSSVVFVRYPKGARIKPRRYFEKGLRPRRKRLQEAFHEVFDDLQRSQGSAG